MLAEQQVPRRLAGMKVKVDRFYIMAVIGFVAVILVFSYKQGLFIPHVPLYFHTAEAAGIAKGTPVKLFGLQVGSVKQLTMTDQRVKVELSIATEYMPQIPRGAQIKLAREGYIGSSSLQFTSRADAAARASDPVKAGDELEYVAGRGIAETIDEIKEKALPVVAELRATLVELNRPDGGIRNSLAAVTDLLAELKAAGQDTRRLVQNGDRAARAAEASFKSMSRVTTRIDHELPAVIGKLTTTLQLFNDVAKEVRETTKKSGDTLHETLRETPALVRRGNDLLRTGDSFVRDGSHLVRDGSDLVRDGQDVMSAVRGSWPIRNMVDTPATRTLPVDSFETDGARRTQPILRAPR